MLALSQKEARRHRTFSPLPQFWSRLIDAQEKCRRHAPGEPCAPCKALNLTAEDCGPRTRPNGEIDPAERDQAAIRRTNILRMGIIPEAETLMVDVTEHYPVNSFTGYESF